MSGRSRRLHGEHRRQRRRVITGAAVAALLVVAIVLVVFSPGGPSESTTDESALVVSMAEQTFDPDPIEVALEDARLRIVNDGQLPHSFVVPDLGKGTPDLAPGDEMTLDLTAQPAGTYTVICDLPGHREAGMETTITLR